VTNTPAFPAGWSPLTQRRHGRRATPIRPRVKRDPVLRPLTWRLPLVAFLITGLVGLVYIDRLLTREFREQGVTQAVQAQSLLESHLDHRVALLSGVTSLIETSTGTELNQDRVARFVRRVFEELTDVRAVAYADARGVVRAVVPREGWGRVRPGTNLRDSVDIASALDEARFSNDAAATRTMRLGPVERGVVLVEPVRRDRRITGYIVAAISYPGLFNDALGGRLLGRFAYQIRDDSLRVIARSPAFSSTYSSIERRPVRLPGSHQWVVDVAIPRMQPIVPRLLNWLVGSLLLLVVVLLVVREEAQSRRFAERTEELELLSRDLLDANVRLEERSQQIAEANRAKSRFLANVSHELRTPLNAIVGYNSLARDGVYGELSSPLRGVHDRIAAAADHLLGLVNDVLDLSKIEVGRMGVEPQSVNVGALVDAVATVIEPMASAKRLHVDVVVSRDVPELHTDPGHVRQILLNLVANAVKFTERGTITIVARRRDADLGDGVVVIVEDTGIGIAREDQERIFQEFEQVRPSGRGDSLERGTGLGLAIARKLARLLGGDVEVRSAPGAGSRFMLSLPRSSPTVSIGSEDHRPAEAVTAHEIQPAAELSQASRSATSSIDGDRASEDTPPEVRAILDASLQSTRANVARDKESDHERS
jgi:signal transduction histidine kinase